MSLVSGRRFLIHRSVAERVCSGLDCGLALDTTTSSHRLCDGKPCHDIRDMRRLNHQVVNIHDCAVLQRACNVTNAVIFDPSVAVIVSDEDRFAAWWIHDEDLRECVLRVLGCWHLASVGDKSPALAKCALAQVLKRIARPTPELLEAAKRKKLVSLSPFAASSIDSAEEGDGQTVHSRLLTNDSQPFGVIHVRLLSPDFEVESRSERAMPPGLALMVRESPGSDSAAFYACLRHTLNDLDPAFSQWVLMGDVTAAQKRTIASLLQQDAPAPSHLGGGLGNQVATTLFLEENPVHSDALILAPPGRERNKEGRVQNAIMTVLSEWLLITRAKAVVQISRGHHDSSFSEIARAASGVNTRRRATCWANRDALSMKVFHRTHRA